MLRGVGNFQISNFQIAKFQTKATTSDFSNFEFSHFQIANFQIAISKVTSFTLIIAHALHSNDVLKDVTSFRVLRSWVN